MDKISAMNAGIQQWSSVLLSDGKKLIDYVKVAYNATFHAQAQSRKAIECVEIQFLINLACFLLQIHFAHLHI